ncbi:surface antigen BspA-like [Trichomonas vaginalis G3]|uniref:Surface antigen BspA-like n=1 Tax=Trichomonas vaginalis (strain ATCC PRA-98 / G3) TaxID=412133 RepID=A2DCH3_TRIV3|nr:regulation of response to stimulus [Trichomonas vaginalis G3]EAY21910.1 surface antigen BspA-like [Trichomonas vaginalis G3]KAI5487616.1 regulation of response to stimulus [Trichomonas vaginalis G3]|eukprot:XP_001582896.1 surface antigen BspA-like [Trichomonas vaginalis G3]
MTELNQYCFSNMHKLREIQKIPNSILSIGSNAFDSTLISSFTVPLSTVNLSDSVFRDCSLLIVFTIPAGCALMNLGNFIFEGCSSLKKIECIDSAYFVVDNGGLFNKNRTSLICFPPASPINFFSFLQNVQTISPYAFYGCRNLQSILIPDNSISSIGHSAFAYCTSLKYINIPLCVKNIEQSAFIGCSNLHCGMIVQNKSISFRQTLIESSSLSPTVLKDCELITCKHDSFKLPVPNSFFYVFIEM